MPLLEDISLVPAVPDGPQIYTAKHPVRTKKFSSADVLVIRKPENRSGSSQDWRHDLDHDAESVFWLLVYWAMVVQPKKTETLKREDIDSGVWSEITGDAQKRDRLVSSLATGKVTCGLTHSFFAPLQPLIKKLAALFVVDRCWLEKPDVRKQPDYLVEASQRLILKFILENLEEAFMDHPVDGQLRQEQAVPQFSRKSATTRNAEENGETPSPQPSSSMEDGSGRPPLDAEVSCWSGVYLGFIIFFFQEDEDVYTWEGKEGNEDDNDPA